ncbi:MAG: helix-turn-helix domain-containing protein [Solirubrobacteraceae bacterium]
MEPLAVFAENLRRLRAEHGLTQECLADQAGLHLTTIARIETCRRDPKVSVVAKIANGLGVPASELFKGVGVEGTETTEKDSGTSA